jgi:outer membrane protein TolC
MSTKNAWARLFIAVASLLSGASLLGGCVWPGEIDGALVNRYQRSMADRGPQPRMGDKGLEPLLPAKGATGPELALEPIAKTKVIETDETCKVLATEKDPTTGRDRYRLEINRSIKTTTFEVDAAGGEGKPTVQVETRPPRALTTDEVPSEIHDVLTFRVGAKSGIESMIPESKFLLPLTLETAIMRTLANSLDIRVVSYDPAIARQDMVRAAAAFDYALYGTELAKEDDNAQSRRNAVQTDKIYTTALGVKQQTITGAQWSLEYDLSRAWDNGRRTLPDLRSRYEPTLALQVTQPLLRNAGPEYNLSQLQIARVNVKVSDQQFRAKVEDIVSQAIVAYWTLMQARRAMGIEEVLLAQTKDSYERVRKREIIDATKAIIKQVEAAVRIREATLIRAQQDIQDAQDQLARLMADAQVNALTSYEVVPITPPTEAKVTYNIGDQLMTALRSNPTLEQARLAIAAADINVFVAKNQTLPSLNLVGSTGLQNLNGKLNEAVETMYNGDYVSYSLGIQFEYPIGNRDRIAQLRQKQFAYTKSIAAMQNVADQVAVQVNTQVRQVRTSYQEVQAQRAAVAAGIVQLQALDDIERIRAQLTPEFLRTKLDAQATLATSQLALLQAIVNYNNAMANLARATGTTLELNRVRLALPAAVEGTWPNTQSMPAGEMPPPGGPAGTMPALTRPALPTSPGTVPASGVATRPAGT